MILGTIAIVAAMIGVGILVNRRFAVAPEQLAGKPVAKKQLITSHEIGETPATAITAAGAQLDKLRTSQRCKQCRSPLASAGADEALRLGDQAMTLISLRCPQCGTRRPLYVRPASPRPA